MICDLGLGIWAPVRVKKGEGGFVSDDDGRGREEEEKESGGFIVAVGFWRDGRMRWMRMCDSF